MFVLFKIKIHIHFHKFIGKQINRNFIFKNVAQNYFFKYALYMHTYIEHVYVIFDI